MVRNVQEKEEDPWLQLALEEAHEETRDENLPWETSPTSAEAAGWIAARNLWESDWGPSADLAHERTTPPPSEPGFAEDRDWGAAAALADERFEPPPHLRQAPENREWGAGVDLTREREGPPPSEE